MTRAQLTLDDWIAAGFRALATTGPSALRAEALARALGATKGSFYWHFKDLPAFKLAMLDLWRTKVAAEIIEDVMQADPGWPRLEALAANAARPAPYDYGGPGIESAVRAWALADDQVAQALTEMDNLRTTFVHQLLTDVGRGDRVLAQVFYAAYIGLDDLSSKGDVEISDGLTTLMQLIRDAPKSS